MKKHINKKKQTRHFESRMIDRVDAYYHGCKHFILYIRHAHHVLRYNGLVLLEKKIGCLIESDCCAYIDDYGAMRERPILHRQLFRLPHIHSKSHNGVLYDGHSSLRSRYHRTMLSGQDQDSRHSGSGNTVRGVTYLIDSYEKRDYI
jgi:hypothetical protein